MHVDKKGDFLLSMLLISQIHFEHSEDIKGLLQLL